VKNAAALADALMKQGFDLVSGGTDNHLMLIDLRSVGITGKEMQHRLDEVRITANKNAIPNDPQSPFVTSGIRVGTPAVTTRGLKEEDMGKVAELIYLPPPNLSQKATISAAKWISSAQSIRCTNNRGQRFYRFGFSSRSKRSARRGLKKNQII
jgi:glycine/serine hydroxymethyltransferase